jgi:hypothetical protein
MRILGTPEQNKQRRKRPNSHAVKISHAAPKTPTMSQIPMPAVVTIFAFAKGHH